MPNVNGGVLDGVRRIGARVRDLVVDGGMPGAPLGFRIRGATQSGPPASGTWKAGDETHDRAGNIWICTAAGTPGAWTQSGLPALSTLLRTSGPVAGGTADFGGNASNGTDTGTNSRAGYTAPYDMAIMQAGWFNAQIGSNGEIPSTPGNAVTITASLEYPSGTFTFLTFGGSLSAVITSGGQVFSDPVSVFIPSGSAFWIRTFLTVTAGQKWYTSGFAPAGSTSSGGTAQSDLTQSGTVTGSYASPFMPAVIRGLQVSPSTLRIVGIGDSIVGGFNDSGNALGFFGRAFTGYRYARYGQSGEKIAGVGSGVSHNLRLSMCAGANAGLVMYGTNDFTFGSSAAVIEQYLMSLLRRMAAMGMTCYAATIPPLTTSTDSWATTGNQTVTVHEVVRVSLNDWLRAGMPLTPSTLAPAAIGTGGALLAGSAGHPVLRVYDLGSACETATDSGLWKVNGSAFTFTGDGTHPSPAAYAAMAAMISPSQVLADLGVSS